MVIIAVPVVMSPVVLIVWLSRFAVACPIDSCLNLLDLKVGT